MAGEIDLRDLNMKWWMQTPNNIEEQASVVNEDEALTGPWTQGVSKIRKLAK